MEYPKLTFVEIVAILQSKFSDDNEDYEYGINEFADCGLEYYRLDCHRRYGSWNDGRCY